MVEVELCEEFNAGRFAVRAALQALEGEGLVERQPNRGARIREIRLDEGIEISEIRMVVEGLVASIAAKKASTEEIRNLKDIGRRMRGAVKAGESAVYSELNAELHQSLRDIARHETANRIIGQLHGTDGASPVRLVPSAGTLVGLARSARGHHQSRVGPRPRGRGSSMRFHISSVIEALRAMA